MVYTIVSEDEKYYVFKIIESFRINEFRNITDSFGHVCGTYVDEYFSNCKPEKGIISNLSPMGKTLLESKVGDIISVKRRKYKVLSIVD